jgi:hypothetical protein
LSNKTEQYRDKADKCDLLAAAAKDFAVKLSLADVAAQWRHLAEQAEDLERERAKLPPASK